MSFSKFYVVTRNDLRPGQQASQLLHAARQFIHEHPEIENDWFEKSNTIVLLSVENELKLNELAARATDEGIRIAIWGEPDLDDARTAIAFEPSLKSSNFLKGLPLAFRNVHNDTTCSGSSTIERSILTRNVAGSTPARGSNLSRKDKMKQNLKRQWKTLNKEITRAVEATAEVLERMNKKLDRLYDRMQESTKKKFKK